MSSYVKQRRRAEATLVYGQSKTAENNSALCAGVSMVVKRVGRAAIWSISIWALLPLDFRCKQRREATDMVLSRA